MKFPELRFIGKSKGILTIGVLLLCLSMIFLVSSISSYSNSLRKVNASGATLESASQQAIAASCALRTLVSEEAVRISLSGGNATFESSTSNFATYPSYALRLQSFLEGQASQGNLTLNMTDALRPKFHIRPYNISVDYQGGAPNVSAQGSAGSAGSIMGYSLSMAIAQPGLNYYWEEQHAVAGGSADALAVESGAQGSDGAAYASAAINRSKNSTLLLRDSSNATLATLRFTPQAQLSVSFSAPAWSSLAISLNSTGASGAPYVELGENIINVRLEDGTIVRGIAVAGN